MIGYKNNFLLLRYVYISVCKDIGLSCASSFLFKMFSSVSFCPLSIPSKLRGAQFHSVGVFGRSCSPFDKIQDIALH